MIARIVDCSELASNWIIQGAYNGLDMGYRRRLYLFTFRRKNAFCVPDSYRSGVCFGRLRVPSGVNRECNHAINLGHEENSGFFGTIAILFHNHLVLSFGALNVNQMTRMTSFTF
jgi:hypothetical protein